MLLTATSFAASSSDAPIVISHKAPESLGDPREGYNNELIALALEKSKAQYGPYKLVEIPPMNTARLLYTANANIYPNFLTEISYIDELTSNPDITYINFPVDLGITGYRVCFINPAIKDEVKKITRVDQLKKYTIGQGIGWADSAILRYNGFHVIEVQNYGSLFKMVAAGRIDLYCRGINELKKEYDAYRDITRLTYDESFVLTYALPRFFFLGAKNKEAKERMEAGLHLAYNDGSLLKLWHKHNDENLEFVKLKNRKIFKLENPYIQKLHTDFVKYYFDPLK
jgi:hypothetical protein